ncbi:hypothetical protein BDW02DRAFT_26282 [Decorospora gaudefroyi]|uniref:Uncharacterized protein n=1 Tax=Decorospora gaudefroyi TaxID=184978 RepID=A0A6A5K4R8_9PLEO|nr:hypothetical protein BDW02DRAFT_26282 [Decorospora gaudefroyi]
MLHFYNYQLLLQATAKPSTSTTAILPTLPLESTKYLHLPPLQDSMDRDVGTACDDPCDWSKEERLYIQLQYELLFAVASLPAAPYVMLTRKAPYREFCRFFSSNGSPTDQQAGESGLHMRRTLREYKDKRDD